MFRIALRSTLSRKGRILLTSIAVIAGCAFLAGVFVFSDTINASFEKIYANAFSKTDAYVRSSNVIEGDFGDETRERLPESVIDQIAAIPGVEDVTGQVDGFARMAKTDGTLIGRDGPPTFGAAFTDSPVSPWHLVEGSPPSGGEQIVIDKSTADTNDLVLGDQVDVTTEQGVTRVTIVGIAKFASADGTNGATWALFDLPTAQQLVIGQPGLVDSVLVKGDGSVSDEELVQRIQGELTGGEIEVLTGAQITEESQDAVEEGLSFFTVFLTIFAAIALFVGSFIIYNVFSISAAHRQRENALLRAIGASRSQVTRVLFFEALVVGVLGGLLGFAGGVGLAAGIMSLLKAIGFAPDETALTVNASVLVETLIVGVIVTMVCAIAPAIRSGRVPPLAAMRDVSVDRSGISRTRLVSGIVIVALAAAAMALGITSAATWLGVGVALLFTSLVVLGPLFAAPIARALTKPLSMIRGVTGEIAGRNAATSPKRTALTAGALGIGLALLIGVSALGSSVKASIHESVGEQFTGDYAISTESDGFGGLPVSLADQLNELPEVDTAVGFGINLIRLQEDGEAKGKAVLTIDPQRAAQLFSIDFVSGSWSDLDGDSILMSKDKADRDGLAAGDSVDVSFLDGSSETLRIAGVYDSDEFGNLIVSRDLFAGHTDDLFDQQVLVKSAGGIDADTTAAIAALVDQYPTAELQTRDEFIDSFDEQIDGFLNFVYALLGMSIFIATLGILVTMLLAVYERRRELGLVRAIGMTRPQVRSSVRWEALVVALLGSLIGIVLGVSLGWVVVQALKDEGLNTFSVSVPSIAIFVVAASVLGVLAAWFPARRAAKADILDAIATT